jgi:cell division protein FtsZ
MTKTRKTKPMSLKIDLPQHDLLKPKITIFGAGGAGGNAINNMIRSNLEGVEFVAANTDAQALQNSLAQYRIQLGVKTTKGLGAGSFPDRGRVAAEENIEEIEKYLEGNNMVFIAAGMGGGTGTGAAPVIAKLARERDILTVGVVTKPFHFEGKYRMETAEAGIEELKKYVDTLIVIPNQNLFRIANEQTTFESAFKMADDVLHAGVRGVTDLITMPGLVNLDFADIRTIMTKMGKAMMGTGEATGENRAILACEAAVSNPLLDDISIKGAKGVLVNMTGGPDMTLFEADMAVNAIKKEVDPNANIIFGSAFNENMKGKIRISVVATGIDADEFRREPVKAPEINEPSRFRLSFGSSNEDKQNQFVEESAAKKSFFDPGVSAKVQEEEIEEIGDNSFKPKKSFLKEANNQYGKEEISAVKKSIIAEDEDEFTQVSFFGDDLEDELRENEDGEKFQEIEKPVSTAKQKSVKAPLKTKAPISKKENSGFSLFSFMNSSKVRDEDSDFEEVINETEIEIEESVKKVEIKTQNRPVKKPVDSEKKRREFFSATVLDEDNSFAENGQKVEDDILNVPAFFRRKKS